MIGLLQVVAVSACLTVLCAPVEATPFRYAGGDGSAPVTAIQFEDLTDPIDSYLAGHAYVVTRYRGAQRISFQSIWRSQRMYDVYRFIYQGERKTIYFDVTDRYVRP